MSKKWLNSFEFKMLMECPFYKYDEEEYAGIYVIINDINGKVYVGQSKDVFERIDGHKSKLRNNKHHNRYLQASWNKHGEVNFSFHTVEFCYFKDLTERENCWMEYYKSYEKEYGYNILKPSENMQSFSKPEKYSKEEMISYLQEFYYMEGRVPTIRDLESNKYGRYPSQYKETFGNFREALVETDLLRFVEYPNLFNRQETTRKDVIDRTRVFIEKNFYFPSQKEMSIDNGLYSQRSLDKHFKSTDELAKLFGYDKETMLKFEKFEALACLREIYEEEGLINFNLIDKSLKCKSSNFYYKHFKSLPNAYKLAGIDIEENTKRNAMRIASVRKENYKKSDSPNKTWNYPTKEKPVKPPKHTKEETFRLLSVFEEVHNRIPNYREIKVKNGLVGMNIVEKLFKGYRNMMAEYQEYKNKIS